LSEAPTALFSGCRIARKIESRNQAFRHQASEYGTAASRITFCPALPVVIFNDLQADGQPKL